MGLNEEEAAVCVALYSVTKQHAVTDENLVNLILQKLNAMEYGDLEDKQIYSIIKRLTDLEIVTIDNGKFILSQYVYFR